MEHCPLKIGDNPFGDLIIVKIYKIVYPSGYTDYLYMGVNGRKETVVFMMHFGLDIFP